ncbi:fused response regulator/phosphatase [Nocardioides mesophilus]|uniref:Fused response regulator/phosphatase n=1 Tax=Nocardioides mesophilus TaxID=433659 RepID=A0A7G9RCI0_9ACTN|nr:fused response regulator/phosphatase [Nocardioides mesophilus]QNN53305.1 fused response regulator/phosphatase [Nocardioides mesophilus]
MKGPFDACVLVCDDTPAKRYVISSWLRREGFTVLEAETGAQAIEIAQGGDIDLAVLDVHLPDMTGLDVCAIIKRDPHTAATPVMHISAVAVEPEDRSAGLENGADAYMVDPIEPVEMISMVRSLLRSSKARRSSERLTARLQQLATASLRINVALNAVRVAAAASEAAARVLETECLVVLVNAPDPATAARTDAAGTTSTWELSIDLAAALLQGAVQSSEIHAADAPWKTLLAGCYDGPWRITPVHNRGQKVGLILVPAPALAGDDDEMLLGRLVQTVSVTLGNLLVFLEKHRTSLALQRSLLPANLPSLPGLVIAARYTASDEQAEVGGDFFDAFQVDDGSTVVVIGDVQGHSLEAAVVMAELRYSLRAYAYEGLTPAEVLSRVNGILMRGHDEMTATVCLLMFSADHQTLVVANAGHLPPLIVLDGVAKYVDHGGSLLGVDYPPDQPLVVPRPTGARILLMTDGLVERRGEDMTLAMDRLAGVLEDTIHVPVEPLCDQLMEQWGGGDDDVALILLDVVDPPRT